jgi:hypothetical protein
VAVAEEWAGSHPGGLSSDEAEFLHCSREAKNKLAATELAAAQELARIEAARAAEAERATEAEAARRKKAEDRVKKLRRLAWVFGGVTSVVAAGSLHSYVLWSDRTCSTELNMPK